MYGDVVLANVELHSRAPVEFEDASGATYEAIKLRRDLTVVKRWNILRQMLIVGGSTLPHMYNKEQ